MSVTVYQRINVLSEWLYVKKNRGLSRQTAPAPLRLGMRHVHRKQVPSRLVVDLFSASSSEAQHLALYNGRPRSNITYSENPAQRLIIDD